MRPLGRTYRGDRGAIFPTVRTALRMTAAATIAAIVVPAWHPVPGAATTAAPIYGVTIPDGYRDWRLISVAHEAGDLNDLRAILGNDLAVHAAREGRVPFPDGAIIARLAWSHVASEENNKVFGREQSFVAGAATNVQFMVKDSTRYAATGGWGFAQFKDGVPADEAVHTTCFTCHAPAVARDLVFTQYSR
jgi:hypothetical protein